MLIEFLLWIDIMKIHSVFKYCSAFVLVFGLSTKADATAYDGYELETIASGLSQPYGVCVDSSKNVFFSEVDVHNLKEILVSSGYTTTNTITSSLTYSLGICIDSAQNIYVADGGNTIKQILASSGYTTINTLVTSLNGCFAVGVDSSDNLYATEYYDGRIKQILASGGYTTINTIVTGLGKPQGICVDNENNLYVTEYNSGRLRQVLASGGYTTVNIIATGLSNPQGICTDSSKNIYFSEYGTNSIKEILASGGYTTTNTLATGLGGPMGLAIDSSNTLYFAEIADHNVRRLVLPAPAPTAEPVLEVDFTDGGQFTAPITGGVKFVGSGSCMFSGSATSAIEIHQGNVKVASATPLGTHGVNMTGGSLEATAAMTLPALTMTNAAAVQADADNVHVATASGNGALTLVGIAGTEKIYLDAVASTGGVSSVTNPVHLTNLNANAGTFNELDLDSLPGSNVYGSGDTTAHTVVVGVDIPAGAFGGILKASVINLSSHSLRQDVTANG